jgi:uncharacterized protein (DUF433 family)
MPADKPTTLIVLNPRILGGTPVVEGTRVPAGNVLAELASGADKMAVFLAEAVAGTAAAADVSIR